MDRKGERTVGGGVGVATKMKYLNEIVCGDCLKIMKEMSEKSIDLILTDPPYGINLSLSGKQKDVIGDDGFSVMFFLDSYLAELKRILKDGCAVYIFTRYDVFPYWWLRCKNYFNVKNAIIWAKGSGGQGDLTGNYNGTYEMIIFGTKGRHLLRGKRESNVWEAKRPRNKQHPTQKPLTIIRKIIEKSTNEHDVVLDPFVGSGTTAVASKELNRNFIGIEIDRKYAEIARARVATVERELF